MGGVSGILIRILLCLLRVWFCMVKNACLLVEVGERRVIYLFNRFVIRYAGAKRLAAERIQYSADGKAIV